MQTSSIVSLNIRNAIKKGKGKDNSDDENIMTKPVTSLGPHKVDLQKQFMSDTAYVTFKDMVNARLCGSSILFDDANCVTKPAASPSDIQWSNHVLKRRPSVRLVLGFLGFIVTIIVCIFWIIPVGFAVSLANLSILKKFFPPIEYITRIIEANPIALSFVVGFLPQLVIIIFYVILIPILKLIEKIFNSSRTESGATAIVMNKFFAFRVVNIFFGGILANAASQIAVQLTQLASSPISIVPILGKAIPLQQNFFIQFVLVNGLMTASLKIVNFVGLALHLIFRMISGKTPRGKAEVYTASLVDYITDIPFHTFIFLLVIVFSGLSPLMLLVGLVFYLSHYFADRYVLLYSKKTKWDSGGLLWPIAFQQFCICMILYHLVMLGVFINTVWVFGIVMAILCLITIIFYWIYVETVYRPLAYYGSIFPRAVDKEKRTLKNSDTYKWAYLAKGLQAVPKKEIDIIPKEGEEFEKELQKLNNDVPAADSNVTFDYDRPYSDGDIEKEDNENSESGNYEDKEKDSKNSEEELGKYFNPTEEQMANPNV
jgi:hypothetical protein